LCGESCISLGAQKKPLKVHNIIPIELRCYQFIRNRKGQLTDYFFFGQKNRHQRHHVARQCELETFEYKGDKIPKICVNTWRKERKTDINFGTVNDNKVKNLNINRQNQ
jgi:hypothetical protein